MAYRYHNGAFEPCAVKQYHVSKTIERTGTLPITINADGNALLDYRIYGAAEGVGDRTENLYNPMAPDVEAGCYYDAQNLIHYRTTSDVHSESGFIPVTEGSYNFSLRRLLSGFRTFINFYDTSKNFVNNLMDTINANGNYALNVSATGFIRFNTVANYADQYMLTSGSTAEYAPYGYKLPMSVSDGMTSTTTPIYIGSDPLGEDEYVDYQAGKAYRRTENIFNIDDLWDKGTPGIPGNEFSIFLEIPVENGTYTAATNVPNNSNPNIASVFIAQSINTNPPSATNGVFINRPRTITTTTGKLYIGVRVRSAAGYQTFTKETFAPYYINVVSGSSVPTTAIPYLQPTDPPVPLPEIPTVDGTTIIDYDGTPKPSQMYIKYNSHGGWEPCTEYVRRNGVWVQQTAPAQSQQSLSPQMSLDVQPIQSPSQTMGVDEPIALETDVIDNNGGGEI